MNPRWNLQAISTAFGPPAASARASAISSSTCSCARKGTSPPDDLFDLIRREDSPNRAEILATTDPREHAHQPRDGLPHAAVDGGRRHRAESRFRRRPVPVRAFVPSSAPLPPDLQDLQPLVRIPQLRHRIAARGSGGGAELHAAAERAADPRHVRVVPDRTAAGGRRRRDRAAVRARRAAHRDRHRAQRPRVLLARRRGSPATRAAGGSSRSSPTRRRSTSARSRRATASCCSRIRSSSRGRRSCSSRARPTACSPPAPSGWPTASTIARR